MEYRSESDALGEKKIPQEAYYGIQTLRAHENFAVSGDVCANYREYIQALGFIKKAAAHANRMARLLADRLSAVPGIRFTQKVESNQLFLTMPRRVIDKLLQSYFFYFWDEAADEIRLVTSFDTTEEDIRELLATAKSCY